MSHDTDHDLTVEIANTIPGIPALAPVRAYLVHIYPPGPNLGMRHPLTDRPLILGRDISCDICIDDTSVSRQHARFQPDGDGYSVVDLHSTNGTSVNKMPVAEARLQDGDDLRIGNCIYRYLASGNVEAQYHEEIHKLTITDVLTHISNRRHLLQCLNRELLRSARYKRPLALVLFDIDHFKTVNDRFGHLGGDFTLRELAHFVLGIIRKEGMVARYGGEEFAVVLETIDQGGGRQLAERVRQEVQRLWFHSDKGPFQCTLSLGMATFPGDGADGRALVEHADQALYYAKHHGRNQAVAYADMRELNRARAAS